MKQLVTILFLVIMTAQAAGLYCQSGNMQNSSMHDIDEKHNDGTKDFKKEGVVFVSVVVMDPPVLLNKSACKLSQVIIIAAPVMDHFAPPPDHDVVNG